MPNSKTEDARSRASLAATHDNGRMCDGSPLEATHDDDDSSTGKADERREATFREACDWREANGAAWDYADHLFCKLGAEGKRISVQRIFEEVRGTGELAFTDARGKRFGVDNDFLAIFARMLCREHPEYAHLVETRRSAYDALLDLLAETDGEVGIDGE